MRPSIPLSLGIRRSHRNLEAWQRGQLLTHRIQRRHIGRAQAELEHAVAEFHATRLDPCRAADHRRDFGHDMQETIALRATAKTFDTVAREFRRRVARKLGGVDIRKRLAHRIFGNRIHACGRA